MFPLMTIALLGWFPVAILLFSKMPVRRALVIASLGAVMFLPMGELKMPFIAGRKDILISMGILLAALIADPKPLVRFRPKLIDLPMAMLCLNPLVCALANGISAYDAASFSLSTFLSWGTPYLLGRVYLTTGRDAWYLAWC